MKTAIKDTTTRQSGQKHDHSASLWRCIRGGNGIGYSYDPATRRVAEIYTSKRGANNTLLYPIQDLQYLYDPVGDVKGLTNNMYVSFDGKQETVNRSFSYDGFYRLTSSDGHLHDNTLAVGQGTPPVQTDEIRNYSVTTAFNDIHNLTGKTQAIKNVDPYTGNQTVDSQYDFTGPTNGYNYTSGKPHFVSSVGGLTRNNDADGNNTGYSLSQYEWIAMNWDEEDRMTYWGYSTPGGSTSESYVYNEAGERTVKTYFQSYWGEYEMMYPNQFYTTSYYTWLGHPGVYGRSTKNIYVGNQRVASVIDNTSTFYYHSDHLGSTTYLTDVDGKVREHMEYTPWGEGWVQQNDVNLPQNYLFTGKEQDATSGLYYFGARYYDPQTSVWMSADPALGSYLESDRKGNGRNWENSLFNSKNFALYSYSFQDPIKYIDPDGRIASEARDGGSIDYNAPAVGSYYWNKYCESETSYTISIDLSSSTSPETKLVGRLLNASIGLLFPGTEYNEKVDRITLGLSMSDAVTTAGVMSKTSEIIAENKKLVSVFKAFGKLTGGLSLGLTGYEIINAFEKYRKEINSELLKDSAYQKRLQQQKDYEKQVNQCLDCK